MKRSIRKLQQHVSVAAPRLMERDCDPVRVVYAATAGLATCAIVVCCALLVNGA